MGWANCGVDAGGRPIGYAVHAECDHPECAADIDRGLAYACGGMHGDCGGNACVGYFCQHHLRAVDREALAAVGWEIEGWQLCDSCYQYADAELGGEHVLHGDREEQ